MIANISPMLRAAKLPFLTHFYDNMGKGPVSPEAFQQLFNWITMFSYYYILPLILVGLLSMISFATMIGVAQPATPFYFQNIWRSCAYTFFGNITFEGEDL